MTREELALVSMACRFPGAPSTQDFWQSLKHGRDLLSEIPLSRWDAQRYYDPQPGVGGKCATTKGYFLDEVRQFDAGFFRIQPEDAEVMDPQQRILLELCFEAFASVGYQRDSLSGQKIGVFMGITKSDYMTNIAEALARQELTQKTVVTGILENLIAARISHYFDLNGPALTIDTACSSSLVALHMAKESILAGDCEMALVGGINLNLNVPAFLGMSAAQALSPGEHYHVFDQRAEGFFMGEGGGVILLKKRSQALADQNPILAVLAGSAVNNDGRSISPMAPRSSTQQAVLRKACEDAQVSPNEITLIEAHGTGTQLGDAVEAQTLNAVFAGLSPKPVLSSVKPNIGHLLSAAGMGGIIKVLLCFQHRQIPPLMHYEQPRKELQLETQGFCLNRSLLDVPADQPMLAGINGFGFGGTNAHILLRPETQQVPETEFRQALPDYQKQDYWVGLKQWSAAPASEHPELPAVRVYESRWSAQVLPPSGVSSPVAEPLLILADPLRAEEQQQLAEILNQAGQPCVCPQSWTELERQLDTDPRSFHWVWLLPLSSQALYGNIQTLAKSPLLARCLRLSVVTQGALPAGSSRGALGSDALLNSGLLWGAVSELGLTVQQVDLASGEPGPQLSELATCLLQPPGSAQVALRGAKVWQRYLRQVSLQLEPSLPSRIRPDGVYLITGGASGIGALIAESLAERQTPIQLIVVGRREACDVPGLAALQARIQAKGSQIHYYRVDVSQPAEVRVMCQQILRKYSGLHGVVHAAGQVAPKDLRRTAYQERLSGMAPKVDGLIALRESLVQMQVSLDFFVAFSSLASALPGYGRGLIDYVAANQFMDLYAQTVSGSELPIQVIQWGPWQGTGMATHPALQKQLEEQGIYALSPVEGISAFHAFIDGEFEQALIVKTPFSLKELAERLPASHRVIPHLLRNLGSSRLSVSQIPGQARNDTMGGLKAKVGGTLEDANDVPSSSTLAPFPLVSEQNATQADLEQRLQNLIRGVLAEYGEPPEIGPEDNLMDIGIDSLTAMDLTKALENWGYQELPFELFFEQRNIRDLARYLLTQRASAPASVPFPEEQEPTQVDLEQRLQDLIQRTLAEFGPEIEIGPEDNLMDIGIDSLTAIDLTKALEDWGYHELPFELFFEQQNIRDLARYLLAQKAHSSLTPEPQLSDSHPLSPIQTAFYVAQTLYERPNYSYFRLSVTRHLDPQLLEQACWDLVERHSQLRAVFQQGMDAAGLKLSYQILSLEQLQAAVKNRSHSTLIEVIAPEVQLADYENSFVNQLFELSQAPLMRIGLQQSAQGSHVLLLFHHIVFDGISMRNFLQELWARYRGYEVHIPYLAAPLAASYEEYVRKRQEHRESEAFKAAYLACSDYLSRKVITAEAFISQLAERYAELGSVSAQSQQRHLPLDLSEALSKRAQSTQTPLQMLYLSAYFTALSQWTGQAQLWVQVASAGRHWPLTEIHSLIGSFAELFPVYADLSQSQGLELAQSLRQEWKTHQPLQRVGSDQIARLAQELGLVLPFSFSFAHFEYDWMSPEDQAQVASTQMRGYHAQTQLGLLISENHQGFYYSFNTPQGLFADGELERLAVLFEAALSQIAVTTMPDFWRDFQAAPDRALALKTPEQELNYGELRHTVQQLAHQLEARGLSCGSVLVYWGEAGSESLCLLLACLALGVTWVPVDAQSPAQRVQTICRQAKADLRVSQLNLSETDELGMLSLSELLNQARERQVMAFTLPERSEDALAYIIFTSGSTGQPKGVPILYTSLMRYLGWAMENFGYGPQDRVILTSSLAFDASLRPILATLMRGACLCPVNDQTKRDSQALLNWVREAQITIWSSVPGLWQGVIQALEADPDPLPHLRLIQLGGEVLSSQWLKRWQVLMGCECPVVNLYGPTETTINATSHWVIGPHPEGRSVPIGKALPYLSCIVMSAEGVPCATGEAGELWVSGPSLTPGYLTTTPEDPFVVYQGERYYRTGDRVYQDAEGIFYYLGRQDRQIKLRGYRLEPAEIESVLLSFPNLLEAWVDTLPRPSGSPQLAACVSSTVPLDLAELQNHLAQSLPGYMLPQQIHRFSGFPRLPNGKADLAALRQELLRLDTPPEPETSILPQDVIATRVTEIWQSLLKRQDFGESSDFFQLGGDSLLLMQAYLMLQQDWPQLPKIAIFHSQRCWQDWVRLLRTETTSSSEQKVTPRTLPEQGFGLSPSQMGFYLWHQHLQRDDSLWEARIFLEGELDPERFEQALMQAARRHQLLNVKLLASSPPEFLPCSEPQLTFVYRDLSAETDSAHKNVSRLQALDIFKDPLLHCQLIKQGPCSYLWLIQAHHILADGLSCLILGRDIFAAYQQLLKRSLSVQPPLRSQFSDYLALLELERQIQGEEHLGYWQHIFAQPYQAPNLRHSDKPTGFVSLERKLKNAELATFKQRCQAAGSTLFMGVLSAYHQALSALTGQSDLVIGVAHHGRDYALEDIDQIFGCFARTLPLRLSGLDSLTPELQIQAAQKQYQEAAAHPIDPLRVMRALSPAPRLTTLLGSQFFISFVDLTPLLQTEALSDFTINAQASSTHFQPSNQDMDLFLALKQQGEDLMLTLNVNQAACSPTRAEAFLDQLVETLTGPAQQEKTQVQNRIQFKPYDLSQTGPLDAALISYLPALDHIERVAPSLNRDQIQAFKQRLFPDDQALWLEYLQTPLGQSANLVLPFFANEIKPGQAKRILPAIQRARQQAQALGARVVSLAGLLPALSTYGLDLPALEASTGKQNIAQRLTTGHSTTVVAMLHTIRSALAQLERPLASCHLAVVGLGSIGETTLNALLATGEHPASLTLVDRQGSEHRLTQLAERLTALCQYSGPVNVLLSQPRIPQEVYSADLIISAVSARQVIEISKLRPGTVLVDDSFPHCFEVQAAIQRMQQNQDVLVLGGGLLQLPACERQLYLPLPHPELQAALTHVSLPACLPGCQLESLLLAAHPELPETLGLVEPDKLLQYVPVIQAVGIQAAPLHLEAYRVPDVVLQALRCHPPHKMS